MDKYAVGLAGELKACEYLRNKNYVILDRNVVFNCWYTRILKAN